MDAWLAESERPHRDIISGTQKEIVWAGEPGTRTAISLVYIHGFSASPREISPVMELAAKDLGANVFFTRLKGHSMRPTQIGAARSEDWLHDALEALAIGQRIGEKTIVVGRSTGATLSAWLLTLPNGPDAAILLSPNFGPKDSAAELVLLPWLNVIVPMFIREHSWEPRNEYQAHYWTTRYPTTAVVEMMELVRGARGIDYSKTHSPALILYNPNDSVVDSMRLKRIVSLHDHTSWTLEAVDAPSDYDSDVFTGDGLAPEMTQQTRRRIVDFVEQIAR